MHNDNDTITYHRNPTLAEIRFGYGAIHYRDFTRREAINAKTGKPKRWLKADDGLRYYR
jgi:hypothetical protein